MAVSLEVKRVVVLVLSAALLIVSALSIANLYMDLFSLILNILVIIGSIGGIIGAWRMDVRHLGWFFCQPAQQRHTALLGSAAAFRPL